MKIYERMPVMREEEFARNGREARAVWVDEDEVVRARYSRKELFGTSDARGGYEKATFKWFLEQIKRIGGVQTSWERIPKSIDNVWYQVSAWRDPHEPRDPGLDQHFTADSAGLRDAKRYAKGLVDDGIAHSAEVAGWARFVSSSKGYGSYLIETLGEYRGREDAELQPNAWGARIIKLQEKWKKMNLARFGSEVPVTDQQNHQAAKNLDRLIEEEGLEPEIWRQIPESASVLEKMKSIYGRDLFPSAVGRRGFDGRVPNPTSASVLDLRKVLLSDTSLFRSANKPEAEKFATQHGWRKSEVMRAGNRFSTFWVVGQCIGPAETLRLLNRDGSWVDMPWPGKF